MKFNNIQHELNTRIILQLYKEYDHICEQYKLNLKKPLIILNNLNSSWGTWDPIVKTIALSHNLIREYSWDVVLCVLKHEIAHQIVSDLFSLNDNHGHFFQKACELINVPKEYRNASLKIDTKLSQWRNNISYDDDSSISRKLEKLLSLAQSANENEALLAMKKVQELYEKYNINRIHSGIEPEFFSLIINFKKKNVPSTYIHIASLIQSHYFVNVVFSELYDPLCDESYKTIEILGTRHNIIMAEYIFYFLKERMESIWSSYQNDKKISNKYKLSFQKGLLVGFRKKLDLIKKEKIQKESVAKFVDNQLINHQLIKIEDLKLNEFTKKMFPNISKINSSSQQVYSEHYNQGQNEGKKIILNKPVSKSENKRRFLENVNCDFE